MDAVYINIETRLRGGLLSVELGIGNELLVLLGKQGSGKTELLRSIAGVFLPEHGVIEIHGRAVFNAALLVNLPPAQRYVGWVPPITALFPNQTVYENALFPLRKARFPQAPADARVREVLDLLELSSLAGQRLGEIPPLRQQTVALARALVTDPDVLLLDEPYRGLDVADRRAARRDLKELRRRLSVPAIYATTDLEEAYELADRVALLDAGELHQVDPPRTLVTKPRNRVVADLVRSVNVFPGKILEEQANGGFVRTPLGTLQTSVQLHGRDEVEVVIRPEHIRVLRPGDSAPEDQNILTGEIVDVVQNGQLRTLRFKPDATEPGMLLEITVSDLLCGELGLDEPGSRTVVLPLQAIHLMEPQPLG
jgi:ABC-type Fe3+/spermidine/putrescine transport system ATPase subunit